MKNKQHLGFTIVELLVVISIIALLVGILVPAVQKARDSAKVTQAKSNIHQVMIALQTYASDHNDRQFSVAPDNLSSGDRQNTEVRTAIQNISSGDGYPLGIRLGTYDGMGVIHFIGIDTWYGGETGGIVPYCFQSGLTTSSTGKNGYGVWRYPNALQVAEYMEGDTLHDAYFSPKDNVALRHIEDCDDVVGSYCPTSAMTALVGGTPAIQSSLLAAPSSFTIAPTLMYHPAVYQWNIFASQKPTDPMRLPRGFKPPSLDQTRYPAHKTWLMEHHWLQNLNANECSRRLGASWMLNGTGTYDGCQPSFFNAHPNSEPVTVFADGTVQTYSMNDFILDSALSTDSNPPGDVEGLWLPSAQLASGADFPFDSGSMIGYFAEANEIVGVRWSGHTHTKHGARGRDKIAK